MYSDTVHSTRSGTGGGGGAGTLQCASVRRPAHAIEHLARVRHHHRAAPALARPGLRLEAGGIAVAEGDARAALAGDAGGESDADARGLHLADGIVRAEALHVGGMGEDPSRIAAETVPLAEEVVAAVIADLVDEPPVHVAHLRHVGGEDHDLAPVG